MASIRSKPARVARGTGFSNSSSSAADAQVPSATFFARQALPRRLHVVVQERILPPDARIEFEVVDVWPDCRSTIWSTKSHEDAVAVAQLVGAPGTIILDKPARFVG